MRLNPFRTAPKEVCEVHGHHAAASGNRMLGAMVLASLALVIWHVWTTGTTNGTAASFPRQLGDELWDLLFNKKGILGELWEVLPYFLVGIVIAGYLRTFKVAVKLQTKLRKYGVLSVFLASFVGIITPLCACGTLTTAISLLFAGIPLAPVMSLMVTSPLMSPTTYLLTLNDLGPEWTAVRTISAFSMGIFAGLITYYAGKIGGFGKNDIFIEGAIIRGDFHDDDYPDERLRCNCRRNFGNRVAVRTGNKFYVFLAKSVEMLWVVGKYVIVGVVVGEVVERYMPSEWLYRFFGQKNPLNIIWITLASVPIFLHQISASSILYHIKGSLAGTIDNGAALAFMIGGPVTAVPTMVMFWTFFKKRVFALYMFVCLTGTVLIAYAFQYLVFTPGVDLGNELLRGVASLSGGASCILEKHDPNVRMVLDPGGKGTIATYTNDVEALGPVVFDTAPQRFAGTAADRFNNGRYIANIAQWLGQNANTPEHGNILVYYLSGSGAAGSPHLLDDRLLAKLAKKGFTVRLTDRKETPRLTDKLLADYGQVWLFFGADRGGLDDTEIKLIVDHNANGGGTLIVPASADSGGDVTQGASRLAAHFGVSFAGIVRNGDELHVSTTSGALNRMEQWINGGLKMVGKI